MSESVVFFVLLLCRVLFSYSSEFFLIGGHRVVVENVAVSFCCCRQVRFK